MQVTRLDSVGLGYPAQRSRGDFLQSRCPAIRPGLLARPPARPPASDPRFNLSLECFVRTHHFEVRVDPPSSSLFLTTFLPCSAHLSPHCRPGPGWQTKFLWRCRITSARVLSRYATIEGGGTGRPKVGGLPYGIVELLRPMLYAAEAKVIAG